MIEDIDDNLSRLNALYLSAMASESPSVVGLYQTSDAIAATAGLFGLDALGKAAFSLCELISEFEESKCWPADPVKVHLDAMRMLRQFPSTGQEDETSKLLEDLSLLLRYYKSRKMAFQPGA